MCIYELCVLTTTLGSCKSYKANEDIMGKLNEYEPIERFQNFSNPTTKPFKSGAVGFQEKSLTLQERIFHRLKKAGKLIEALFSAALHNHSTEVTNRIRQSLGKLNNDIYLIQDSLDNKPLDFNSSKLEVNPGWIEEMKDIIEDLRNSILDTNEPNNTNNVNDIKNIGRLNHILTELDHLMQPRPGFKEVKEVELFKVGLSDIKPKMESKPKFGTERPQVNAQARRKNKMLTKPKKPTALKAKPAKTAVKKAVKKPAKAAAKKTTKAKVGVKAKSAVRSSKPKVGVKAKSKVATKRVASKRPASSAKSKVGVRKAAPKSAKTAVKRTVKRTVKAAPAKKLARRKAVKK